MPISESNFPTTETKLNYDDINKDNKKDTSNKMKNFLKETAELRKNMISKDDNDKNNISDFNLNKNIKNNKNNEIPSLLKNLPSNYNNYGDSYSNTYRNTNFPSYSNNYNRNKSDLETRVKYLNDLDFKNPDWNAINDSNFKVIDEIGKKCLDFTNDFRKKNRMPLLK